MKKLHKKEKTAQRALGILKKYVINISADTLDSAWAQEIVEAPSKEEAEEMVQKMIDDDPEQLDWDFTGEDGDDRDVDESSIQIEDVLEEDES